MPSKAINSLFEIGPSFPKGIFGHKKRPLRGKVINTKLAVSLYFLLGPPDDPTTSEQHYHFSNVIEINFCCCCCEKRRHIMCKECCEWILSCMDLSDEQQSTQTLNSQCNDWWGLSQTCIHNSETIQVRGLCEGDELTP